MWRAARGGEPGEHRQAGISRAAVADARGDGGADESAEVLALFDPEVLRRPTRSFGWIGHLAKPPASSRSKAEFPRDVEIRIAPAISLVAASPIPRFDSALSASLYRS